MSAETEVRDGLVAMIDRRISTLPRQLDLDDDHLFRIKFRADEIYREVSLSISLTELLIMAQQVALADSAEELSTLATLARLRARRVVSRAVLDIRHSLIEWDDLIASLGNENAVSTHIAQQGVELRLYMEERVTENLRAACDRLDLCQSDRDWIVRSDDYKIDSLFREEARIDDLNKRLTVALDDLAAMELAPFAKQSLQIIERRRQSLSNSSLLSLVAFYRSCSTSITDAELGFRKRAGECISYHSQGNLEAVSSAGSRIIIDLLETGLAPVKQAQNEAFFTGAAHMLGIIPRAETIDWTKCNTNLLNNLRESLEHALHVKYWSQFPGGSLLAAGLSVEPRRT